MPGAADTLWESWVSINIKPEFWNTGRLRIHPSAMWRVHTIGTADRLRDLLSRLRE